jgi:hypothetical protein
MPSAGRHMHAHTHERMLASLPLSLFPPHPTPPCRCHAHARTRAPTCGHTHAHMLVLSHSFTATSQVPIQPRAPSSRGRWTHGQAGTATTTTTPLSRRLAPPAAHSGPVIFKAAGRQREGTGLLLGMLLACSWHAPGIGRARWPSCWPANVALASQKHRGIQFFPLAVTTRKRGCERPLPSKN